MSNITHKPSVMLHMSWSVMFRVRYYMQFLH